MADKILEKVDSSRRSFLKRVLGAGFAAPVIAAFSIEALTTDMAHATDQSNLCADQFDEEDLFLTFFEERADPACGPTIPDGSS